MTAAHLRGVAVAAAAVLYAAIPVEASARMAVDDLGRTYTVTPPEPEARLEDWETDLIALVTMAEAEGEPEEGKRLVIDTILNRMDSPYFPDTAYEVIYQRGQFTSMWDGRASRCHAVDDVRRLVREELRERTDGDVMFFTAGGYGRYGVPMFQIGNHYFSSYN